MFEKKLLIVEDQHITALDLKSFLGKHFEITGIAKNGIDAVMNAHKTHPDVILMDIMINGKMSGIDTAKFIRDQVDIPVVFLTALGDDETYLNAQMVSPYGYVIKPYDGHELLKTINNALCGEKIG